MRGLMYLTNSPCWLLMRGRSKEAWDVLARLADSASESEEVDIELNNIRKALEVQSEGDFQLEELLMKGTSQNLRPTLLRFGPDGVFGMMMSIAVLAGASSTATIDWV
ncbi:hypothetical protein KC333_g5428 [Hortaea werneckii]|nr:hypothetical protein KC333_g5428 [Hortaea werneckii]KAI7313493.1 hypothetical protein KC326_g5493 [Hortaea werneckii]